jgi:REP-associated tyrosine transposase
VRFAWQEGYAAFSVSSSQEGHTVQYINSQEQHHAKRDFAQELRLLLEKHGIEYDPKFLLG